MSRPTGFKANRRVGSHLDKKVEHQRITDNQTSQRTPREAALHLGARAAPFGNTVDFCAGPS